MQSMLKTVKNAANAHMEARFAFLMTLNIFWLKMGLRWSKIP